MARLLQMDNDSNFQTYIFLSKKEFNICIFQNSDFKKIYEKKLLLDNHKDELEIDKLNSFLDENIIKIEKKLNSFIKKIFLILETDSFFHIDISIKKNNSGNKLTTENLTYTLNELREQCKKTLENKVVIHMIIKNYLIDNKNFSFLPENLKCYHFSLDVKFICLSEDFIQSLEKHFKRYQISVDRIISANYINFFFNDENNEFFKNAKDIIEGRNLNEIGFNKKTTKNQGFFEKFFNFFS